MPSEAVLESVSVFETLQNTIFSVMERETKDGSKWLPYEWAIVIHYGDMERLVQDIQRKFPATFHMVWDHDTFMGMHIFPSMMVEAGTVLLFKKKEELKL